MSRACQCNFVCMKDTSNTQIWATSIVYGVKRTWSPTVQLYESFFVCLSVPSSFDGLIREGLSPRDDHDCKVSVDRRSHLTYPFWTILKMFRIGSDTQYSNKPQWGGWTMPQLLALGMANILSPPSSSICAIKFAETFEKQRYVIENWK